MITDVLKRNGLVAIGEARRCLRPRPLGNVVTDFPAGEQPADGGRNRLQNPAESERISTNFLTKPPPESYSERAVGLKGLSVTYDLASRSAKKKQPTCIAVWVLQSRFLEPNVHVVHAPYSGNPNLAAQEGAITFLLGINKPTPLNEYVADERGDERRDLHKCTLPINLAPSLLYELRLRGYDAGRLSPGYAGAAKPVKELVTLAQFPEVKRHVFEEPDDHSIDIHR